MRTAYDIASAALAAVGAQANLQLAGTWVAERYRQLTAKTRLRSQRLLGEVVMPAAVSAGAATATAGSREVTGDATARAAWTPALRGRYFRTATVWYEIADVTPTPSLLLVSPFAETSTAAGTYAAVPRFVPLDPAARWLGTIVHRRRRLPLDLLTAAELDALVPDRYQVGSGPFVAVDFGDRPIVDPTSSHHGRPARHLELYPYPTQDELLGYTYFAAVADLGLHDPLPASIDPNVLKDGVLIDVYRFEAARLARAGQVDASAVLRNESRAQQTVWDRCVREAVAASRAVDDLTFILDSGRGGAERGDIRTAYDDWLVRAL